MRAYPLARSTFKENAQPVKVAGGVVPSVPRKKSNSSRSLQLPPRMIQHESNGEEEEGVPPQIKDTPGRTPPVTADVQARVLSLRSGGQHLPGATRAFFESRFNYNFSHVRVHTGAQAAEAARAMNARAFTIGRDMVFGSGQYAPESNEGQQLLAHELTHVVQQTSPFSPPT